MNRKVVGTLARMVNVITVERPQDLAFEGKGLATALKNNTLYVNLINNRLEIDEIYIYRGKILNLRKN